MMTQYRTVLVALVAAFVLSACSGDKDTTKTEAADDPAPKQEVGTTTETVESTKK